MIDSAEKYCNNSCKEENNEFIKNCLKKNVLKIMNEDNVM